MKCSVTALQENIVFQEIKGLPFAEFQVDVEFWGARRTISTIEGYSELKYDLK